MARFILRHKQEGEVPEKDINLLKGSPQITILDYSRPKTLLVEATYKALEQAMAKLSDWQVVEEKTVLLPDTRQKIKR